MSLCVRNEKKLNMQCSKVISKYVRAVRSDCTTQEPSRLVKITRFFFEIPILSLRRRQLERKSTKKHSAGGPQIAQKSILGRLGRPKPFRGRVRTCSGRLLDAQMLPQSRSWVAPDEPRAVKSCPKARRGIPDTLQVPPGQLSRRSQGRSRRQTQSQALPDRFWSDFRSMRGSSEVHFVLVFAVFF